MGEERVVTETSAPAAATARHGMLAVLALVLAVVAAGFSGYQWVRERGDDAALRQELARRLADIERQNKDAAQRASQSAQALKDAEAKLGVLETKLAESQSQQIALEALYQELSRSRDEWAFADIEQSLLLANQQLQIAANVRAALIGLENADARLQRLDQPRYSALRRAMARDIERLKALPLVDVFGTSARLDEAVAGIDRLPLAMEARPRNASAAAPAAEPSGWDRLLRDAWQEVRQLVRIERTGEQHAALLAPDQTYFLRENLKLRLLGARVALVSRDGKNYHSALRAAVGTLERYFDTRDPGVAATLATLRKLQAAPVQAEMPDLGETLELLRKLRPPRPKGPV